MKQTGAVARVVSVALLAGCTFIGSKHAAPVHIESPQGGVAAAPVTNIRLGFDPAFDANAMNAFHVDKFTFHAGDFCPPPKGRGSSVIGSRTYAGGAFKCHAFNLYFWPNAVGAMPHWHRLSLDYSGAPFRALLFRPPYLVVSSLGTLRFSNKRQPLRYAAEVSVQHPAPAPGISVVVSDTSGDTQLCSQDVGCGRAATSLTIAAGFRNARFYVSPFPNAARIGKHHFTIAAVAPGCEAGTGAGTIVYPP